MPLEFESLREHLLREGVAPRHVRRYLTELGEHLTDLTARERAAGHDAGDAAIRARAALGDDEILSRAMLARPGIRSLSARAPWAVFGLLPPLAGITGLMIVALLLGIIANIHGYFVGHAVAAPLWFRVIANLLTGASNYGWGLLAALLFARIGLRQRMSPVWPLAGIALVAICATLFTLYPYFPAIGAQGGELSVSFLPGPHYPFTSHVAIELTVFRLLLAFLPAATLYLVLHKRRTV